jgi:hypothetical protein
MAQRKKKLTKKKRQTGHREPDESDGGDFEVAATIRDDDSVRTISFSVIVTR